MSTVAPDAPDRSDDHAAAAPDAHCPLCGYDLRGQRSDPAPRCPECGRRFDWADFIDPARRRHPYLFEHHPRRPVWSFVRTLLGGLRPRRFWGSIYPTMPSAPRRLIAYCAFGAAVAVLALGQVSFWAAVQKASVFGTGRTNPSALTPLTRYPDWPLAWPSVVDDWRTRPTNPARPWVGNVNQYPSFDEVLDAGRSLLPLTAAGIAWPWLTVAALELVRGTRRQAKVDRWHVARTAVYAADSLLWFDLFVIALTLVVTWPLWGGAVTWQVLSILRQTMGAWPMLVWPAAGAMYLVAVWRLFVAYRLYLRLPHAAGVVVGTQAIVLLVLVGLHVAWWSLAQG